MIINHLGDIVLALDGTSSDKNVMVGILSVANCTGRLGIGFMSDMLRYRMNKAWWMVICLAIFAVTHLGFFLLTFFWYIPLLVIGTGIAYGGTHMFPYIHIILGVHVVLWCVWCGVVWVVLCCCDARVTFEG